MRTIEFRGKNLYGQWVYGDLEYDRIEDEYRIHTYNADGSYDRQYVVQDHTIGQFTGLHDKDGRKIFEGDLVDMPRAPKVKRKTRKTRHVVECHSVCDWTFHSLDKEVLSLSMCGQTDFNSYRWKVIGNIYDKRDYDV